MLYQATTALYKILGLKKRLKIIQGGSSGGKTIGIELILIDIAQSEENKVISIVSESMPHLKKAAMRDFLHIMRSHRYYNEDNWNATDSIYTFPETNTVIEFFSAKDMDKVRGPRRNYLFINECNNVPYEVYRQLALRTDEAIYLDYNPVSEFWVHDQVIPKIDHDFIVLTYKDNEGLPKSIVEEIESHKDDDNFWKVYGLGQLGSLVGQIYQNWKIIDEIPHEARLERLGVDFGYTNDPTAIVGLYYYNGGYIVDELAYQKRLTNKMIGDILKNQEAVLVAADAAEPKSIDELKTYDLTVVGSKKGAGSVNQGIQLVQAQRISVTARSINIIKEYRNYSWQMNEVTGKPINEPIGTWDHAMAAIRYAFGSIDPNSSSAEEEEKASRLLSRLKNVPAKTR